MVQDHPFIRGAVPELWWLSALHRARFGSRQPEPWLPTLTFDWSQSAVNACARNGDRAPRKLQVRAPMSQQEKITFGEMRASGAVRIIVHCGDYKCGRSVTIYPALWPDNVRLSDLEERFVCTVCGHRGADVRPLFEPAHMGTDA